MLSPREKLNQLLRPWIPTDIEEHWDEFTTCQPREHETTKQELVTYITYCEVCRNLLWLTFREFGTLEGRGPVVEEHRLSTRCACDEMEAELDEFLGYNPPEDVPSDELPGMWDHSDFLGEGEWAQPTHVTDVHNYDDRGCLDTRPDEDR